MSLVKNLELHHQHDHFYYYYDYHPVFLSWFFVLLDGQCDCQAPMRQRPQAGQKDCIGVILGLYRDNTPIMENQMEKKMENEMETGIIMDSTEKKGI